MTKRFKVLFYIRKSKMTGSDKASIVTRIMCDGQKMYVGSTGYTVETAHWDSKLHHVKPRHDREGINMQLGVIEGELTKLFRQMEYDADFSLQRIKQQYVAQCNRGCGVLLLEYFDEYIAMRTDEVGNTITPSSIVKYKACRKHFALYLKQKLNRDDIEVHNLLPKHISDFFHFMCRNGSLCNNSAVRRMKSLRTVLLKALREGLIMHDPFNGFHMRTERVNRTFLTEDELEDVVAKTFPTRRLELIRDVFVFACYTGLAYIDICRLEEKHLQHINGTMFIMLPRQKSKILSAIPLTMSTPLKILDKYRSRANGPVIFPMLTNQRTNAYLKEIADVCSIRKELTFHCARHTFATMMLTRGVSIESISNMLGHTNIASTQIYSRIVNAKLLNEMKMAAKRRIR